MKKLVCISFIAGVFALCGLCPAAADGNTEASGLKTVSLTFSPLHLFINTFEVNGELALSDHFGLALIGAYGKPELTSIYSDGTQKKESLNLYEIGGQALLYPFENPKHRFHLGIESTYTKLSSTVDDVSFAANGVSAGGFLGYKYMANNGFTFVAQLGLQKVVAEASDGNLSASGSAVGAMLNLNVGFSF